jgi:hypothetical protein
MRASQHDIQRHLEFGVAMWRVFLDAALPRLVCDITILVVGKKMIYTVLAGYLQRVVPALATGVCLVRQCVKTQKPSHYVQHELQCDQANESIRQMAGKVRINIKSI